jgi:hypothetical protein
MGKARHHATSGILILIDAILVLIAARHSA